MNKRIRNKKQKQIWASPIVSLKKFHCNECNMNFYAQVHKDLAEQTLKYLVTHNPLCPICKNELKPIEK